MQSEVNQEENLNTTDFDEHFAKISSYTYCNSDYLEYTCKYQIISLYEDIRTKLIQSGVMKCRE